MKKIIILLLVVVLIGGLIYYRVQQNNKAKLQNEKPGGARGVTVYGRVIHGQPFSDFINLSGSIEGNEQVELRSEISGIIERINFLEGQYVQKGHPLVYINDAELRAQMAQAETRNSLAAENERRAKLLLEKEAISQEEYDIASADYRTTASQIQLIQAQLSKTIVRAPFSGRIGLRTISPGGYITPTSAIAPLVNTDKVKLVFSVPEKYASKVKVNSTLKFTVEGSSQEYSATVFALQPSVDLNTRTLEVKAISSNPGQAIIPGTFASIIFPLETLEDGLLVPAEALIPIQNGKKVFKLAQGKAMSVVVETGARTDANVLVTSGLVSGDTVLTSGVMSLRDGSAVKVTLR